MRIDIVTPERLLVSTDAASVRIPATEGEMTVMDNHAPVITTLRPGVVKVADGDSFMVTGGFAEITPESASILAEHALPEDEVKDEVLAELLELAEAAVAKAAEIDKPAARQRVNDLSEMRRMLDRLFA